MVNLGLKTRLKREYVRYYVLDNRYLYEDNRYTNNLFRYDLFDHKEKEFFQTRLKHNARYDYNIRIDSYLIFYLHFIKWL